MELQAAVNTSSAEQLSETQNDKEEEQPEEFLEGYEYGAPSEQWNITDMDLTLQYDDRYSLDNIIGDWSVACIKTKEVYSTQVSRGCNTGKADNDVIVQDEKTE